MMPPKDARDREAYEAEVVAILWREKWWYATSSSKAIVGVTLEGVWPATKLIVRWDFAGEARSADFPLYYTDPWREGEAFSSATELAIGILDEVFY
jgi:hypothetical protein